MLEAVALVVVGGGIIALLTVSGVISGASARTGMAAIGAVAALLVLVAVLAAGIVGGLDRGGDGAEEGTTTTTLAPRPVPLRTPTIQLRPVRGDRPPTPVEVEGNLEDGMLVVVAIDAPERLRTGSLHQCPTGAARPSDCRAGLPITTDDDGGARALVDLTDRFEVAGGSSVDCRAAQGCSLVLFGPARLEVITVFGEDAPPRLRVEAQPPRVESGGRTRAVARNVPSGASVTFAACRWSAEDRDLACGAPSDEVHADARGLAVTEVLVGAAQCGRGDSCWMSVAVDGGAPVAFGHLSITGGQTAAYDAARVAAGVAAAVLFLLCGAWLLWRTDWTPVDGDPFRDVVLPDDPFAEVDEPSAV